ncbi:MAG: hypothetical protein KDA57_12540 [Planctomycetales bacterium]|nr:hypothetical protein [Planctomycetales bacterium]
MELNRNQYFFLGIVILLLGLQFRMVNEYVLTDEATQFLAERTRSSGSQSAMVSFASSLGETSHKVIRPPDWLGWCMISVGSVLILHSLAMRGPGS